MSKVVVLASGIGVDNILGVYTSYEEVGKALDKYDMDPDDEDLLAFRTYEINAPIKDN